MYLSTEHETIESVYMVTVKYRFLTGYVGDGKSPYRTLSYVSLYRATTAAMAIAHAIVKYAENHDTEVLSVTASTTELVTC